MHDSKEASPSSDVRLIAFYLPQFHPIPENDAAWGKGFTEWTNVARAHPVFEGHHQPQLPSDLGFYDLRLPETREQQAALAREHGLHGFCYYYYWFNGRRMLERPLNEIVESKKPDFPFCVCWANENWTRNWDGGNREIIVEQHYSPEDDEAFIQSLIPLFSDERYIRIDGRPLLLIYRADLLPEPVATTERWRRACAQAGLAEPYLCAGQIKSPLDPSTIGFDAAFEFPPHLIRYGLVDPRSIPGLHPDFRGRFFDYKAIIQQYLEKPQPEYPLHKSVMTGWDNTPRRQWDSGIFLDSSPKQYESWLKEAIRLERMHHAPNRRMVFINAWNEWGEGAHLEPDQLHGLAYLRATLSAIPASLETT